MFNTNKAIYMWSSCVLWIKYKQEKSQDVNQMQTCNTKTNRSSLLAKIHTHNTTTSVYTLRGVKLAVDLQFLFSDSWLGLTWITTKVEVWIFVLKQRRKLQLLILFILANTYIIDTYYEQPYIWLHIKSNSFFPSKAKLTRKQK